MKKRAILFLVSFGLLAALVYFSNPQRILTSLLKADLRYVAMAVGMTFLLMAVRAYRWDYLLKKTEIDIPFSKVMKYYIAGMFVSNLSPAKTGDPIRAVFLKKLQKESFSRGISSVFMERMVDIITMAVIAIIGIFFLLPGQKFLPWVSTALIVYLCGIILAVYLIFSGNKMEKVLQKLISIFSFLPKIELLGDGVENFSGKFRSSLRDYKSGRTLTVVTLLSAIGWVLNALKTVLIFLSLGFYISPVVAVTVLCASILLSILTLLPGGLGSGEVISVSLFVMFLAVPVSEITTAVLVGRLIGFWMYAALGAALIATFKTDVVDLDF